MQDLKSLKGLKDLSDLGTELLDDKTLIIAQAGDVHQPANRFVRRISNLVHSIYDNGNPWIDPQTGQKETRIGPAVHESFDIEDPEGTLYIEKALGDLGLGSNLPEYLKNWVKARVKVTYLKDLLANGDEAAQNSEKGKQVKADFLTRVTPLIGWDSALMELCRIADDLVKATSEATVKALGDVETPKTLGLFPTRRTPTLADRERILVSTQNVVASSLGENNLAEPGRLMPTSGSLSYLLGTLGPEGRALLEVPVDGARGLASSVDELTKRAEQYRALIDPVTDMPEIKAKVINMAYIHERMRRWIKNTSGGNRWSDFIANNR